MKYDYTIQDILSALTEIGIVEGDDIFIHSNLGFFGVLEGCRSADGLCESFIAAIKTVIGEQGTVITPTFSYSYCHNEVFDPYITRTNCGILSEYMMKMYPDNRTMDPNFSVCGIGQNMEEYKLCNIHEAFGKDSFWDKFKENNGKIVCMNFDSGSTFIHYIEKENDVSYRYNKAFNGQTRVNGEIKKDYAVHFVYDRDDDAPCMERVDKLCKEYNISHQVNLGKGTILAFSVQKYYSFFSELMKERPRVLCKEEML